MIIPTPLSIVERQMFSSRRSKLAPVLAPAGSREIRALLKQAFAGWFSMEDEMGASAVLAQYSAVLRGLPLFAIHQALQKFVMGQVTAADVHSEKDPRKGYRPAQDHLRIVAEKIARPHWDEAKACDLLLNAVVVLEEAPRTEQAKAHAMEVAEAVRRQTEATVAAQDLRDAEAKARNAERVASANAALILAEYRRHGISPVYADAAKTVPVSLPMLLRNGYRIETFGSEKVLVKPGQPAQRPETPSDE